MMASAPQDLITRIARSARSRAYWTCKFWQKDTTKPVNFGVTSLVCLPLVKFDDDVNHGEKATRWQAIYSLRPSCDITTPAPKSNLEVVITAALRCTAGFRYLPHPAWFPAPKTHLFRQRMPAKCILPVTDMPTIGSRVAHLS